MIEKQLELISVPFSAFLKLEMARFAERFTEIVGSHNPEGLKIKPIYDLLLAEKPRISKLTDKFGPHPLTAELNDCREIRSLRISAIKFQLKTITKENKGNVSAELKMVRIEINHFLKNLKESRSEEVYNQRITQFFETIEADAELKTALLSLGFGKYLNDLKKIHNTIQELINRKLVSIARRPKEKTADLVNIVLKAIKIMIKQIEIAPYVNVELNYEPLFNELNQFFTDYINIINKRLSISKKKAEKSEEETNGESTEIISSTPIKESDEKTVEHKTEEVNLNEAKPLQEENKKTAAMSSKTKQRPLADNDVEMET